MVEPACPAIGMHSFGDFILDLTIHQTAVQSRRVKTRWLWKRVGRGVDPCSTKGRTIDDMTIFVIVLTVVLVEARATNVLKVPFNQAIIGCADVSCCAIGEL